MLWLPPASALLAIALLAACALDRPTTYSRRAKTTPGTSLQILTGARSLADDLWEPADDSLVLGVGFAIEPPRSSCGLEVGFQFSRYVDQTSQAAGVNLIDVDQAELFAGVRKTFRRRELVQPYVGGGLTVIDVQAQGSRGMSTLDDQDRSLTAYVHGGVLVRITDQLRIGVDGRCVRGSNVLQSARLFGTEGDVDYDQVALVAEWVF